jgi:hypothetical protein
MSEWVSRPKCIASIQLLVATPKSFQLHANIAITQRSLNVAVDLYVYSSLALNPDMITRNKSTYKNLFTRGNNNKYHTLRHVNATLQYKKKFFFVLAHHAQCQPCSYLIVSEENPFASEHFRTITRAMNEVNNNNVWRAFVRWNDSYFI